MIPISEDLRSFFRVLIVGAISNGLGFLAYLGLTALHLEPKIAMTMLYAVGASIGFFGNRHWSFKHKGALSPAALRYILVYLVGYAIDWLMLHRFVDGLRYPHALVQAAAMAIIAVYLFVAMRFFVFPRAGVPSTY